MSLALVVIEEHTRRAVQLGNDHALSTIDHKGTVIGHERNFTHVHFLFFNVFNRLVGRLTIINDQANFNAQRYCVSHTAQNTFTYIECRFAKVVAYIFKCSIS